MVWKSAKMRSERERERKRVDKMLGDFVCVCFSVWIVGEKYGWHLISECCCGFRKNHRLSLQPHSILWSENANSVITHFVFAAFVVYFVSTANKMLQLRLKIAAFESRDKNCCPLLLILHFQWHWNGTRIHINIYFVYKSENNKRMFFICLEPHWH